MTLTKKGPCHGVDYIFVCKNIYIYMFQLKRKLWACVEYNFIPALVIGILNFCSNNVSHFEFLLPKCLKILLHTRIHYGMIPLRLCNLDSVNIYYYDVIPLRVCNLGSANIYDYDMIPLRVCNLGSVNIYHYRVAGCLKLQVIFRKRATDYKVLLRKMTYKDKASYNSTPPCMTWSHIPLWNDPIYHYGMIPYTIMKWHSTNVVVYCKGEGFCHEVDLTVYVYTYIKNIGST